MKSIQLEKNCFIDIIKNVMYKYCYSIIIPHYSKEGTEVLERAVNSIPQRKDIQVVVVDNSPIRIPNDLFVDKENVYIFYSDNTKGAGHARNVGIEHAKGKWLHFLDADDFFTENAFAEFDRYKDSDYDIIFFKMTSCYSDTLEPAKRHYNVAKLIDRYLDKGEEQALRFMEVPWAKMVSSRLVHEQNIYFDEVKVCNDAIFGLKIGLAAKRIAADRAIVSCITIAKGSLTNVQSLENIETRFNVAIRKNQLLIQNGYPKSKSVIKFIFQSLKYGIRPFSILLFKAISSGCLFVGWRNWIKTSISMLFVSDNKDKYKVKG